MCIYNKIYLYIYTYIVQSVTIYIQYYEVEYISLSGTLHTPILLGQRRKYIDVKAVEFKRRQRVNRL